MPDFSETYSANLKTEEACYSNSSVNIYHTARSHIFEDSIVQDYVQESISKYLQH